MRDAGKVHDAVHALHALFDAGYVAHVQMADFLARARRLLRGNVRKAQ